MATAPPWRRSPLKVLWKVYLPPWPDRYHRFLHFYGCFSGVVVSSHDSFLMSSFSGIVLGYIHLNYLVLSVVKQDSHCCFEGWCVVWEETQTQDFNIYNINENSEKYKFFYNWANKLFKEEDKVPTILYDARKVAGSATYKQSKQYQIGSSFKVNWFSLVCTGISFNF